MISKMRRNIDFVFFLFFLPNHRSFKACQWTKCLACKSMESAWINHSRAAVTCRVNSASPATTTGRICRSTQSPIQSTTSAWVRTFFRRLKLKFFIAKSLSRNRSRFLRTGERREEQETGHFELGSHPILSREVGRHCEREQRTFGFGKSKNWTGFCEKQNNHALFSKNHKLPTNQPQNNIFLILNSLHGQISTSPALSTISTTWPSRIWLQTTKICDALSTTSPASTESRTGSTSGHKLKFKSVQALFYIFIDFDTWRIKDFWDYPQIETFLLSNRGV